MWNFLFSFLFFSVWISPLLPQTVNNTRWAELSAPIGEHTFQWIEVCPQNANILWLSTDKNVYQSQNAAHSWKRIFHASSSQSIFCLTSLSPEEILLGTSEGLFYSQDGGENFKHVFQSSLADENRVLSCAYNPFFRQEWMVGTQKGFFISQDAGEHWEKIIPELGHQKIEKIIYHPLHKNIVFVMSDSGIYKSSNGARTFQKVFTEKSQNLEEVEIDEIQNEEDLEKSFLSKSLGFLSLDGRKLIALTSEGLIFSSDEGETWQSFSSSLTSSALVDLATSLDSNRFYASTTTGVYELTEQGLGKKMDSGLTTTHVHKLVLFENTQSRLFAATDRGVFSYEIPDAPATPIIYPESASFQPEIPMEKLQLAFQKEPSVQATQQAAIRYANVSNEKIQHWHKQSRLKSLIPTFYAGVDKSISNNVDIDRGGTADADKFILGPADKDWGWNTHVSWDLSELIWSSNQTSIDSREKLMVELRDDILSEVTRLYFERRKVMAELLLFPPQDEKTKLALMFQVDELTANLDALTGGWFSEQLNKKRSVGD